MLSILAGCPALNGSEPETVTLTAGETRQVQELANQLQQVDIDRNALNLDYQEKTNRLNERKQELENQNFALCIQIKKAHKLRDEDNYRISEWKGELVRIH